ncbi:MAG: translocation/assembly module TamB domain-containing protein, partial [Moritella sp.]|uniref:translocation/assembly module TamB domain-containing protein n=1 Tax=Moritella sp. TaxID=78556 RepID=UPI00216C3277
TLTMQVRLDESSVSVKTNIQSRELGGMTSDIRIDDLFDTRELSGDINIVDIDLAFIEPLIYQVDVLNGVVSGAGIVGGTLDKPEVIGQFNVNNGYLAGDELPVTLENFQFSIESSGERASITGSANSGKGLAKITGSLVWVDEFNYRMLLHGDNFEFDDNKGLKLHFSPEILVEGDDKGAKITGDIVIPYALIKVEKLPQSAIQVSNDVIIIDSDEFTVKQTYPLDVQVNIKLLDNVKIDSFGLESNITGAISIVLDEDGNLFSDGMLQFENGRYRSFGQDLYIRKGQVVFSGSVENPYINVEAIRNTELTEDNVVVGIRLIGPVKKPVFTIFSEPEMQQTRMISYLLRGRDINSEDETSQDVVITTMLVGSSLGQGKDVIGFLGDTLGVKDFAIDTRGQGDDTRVEVSGYVLPGVQIRYGIGLFSDLSEVVVRYEIIPKLYIELVSGVDSAVDLYYKFSR